MTKGKAFELLVRGILIGIGFRPVPSDGVIVYNGSPGQMVVGLGAGHNADVLLEPPVQTPFFYKSRLIIECKDYAKPVGLPIIRNALGFREDVNNFEIIDMTDLRRLRSGQLRQSRPCKYRYVYQIAVAALNGFTKPAQSYASTHRIPLIEFDKLPFWRDFEDILEDIDRKNEDEVNREIDRLVNRLSRDMAVAVTNSGQLLFLFAQNGFSIDDFGEEYSIYWENVSEPWRLRVGRNEFLFQLPDELYAEWIESSQNDEQAFRENAIRQKEENLSSMIVYFKEYERAQVRMISIEGWRLKEAKERLGI